MIAVYGFLRLKGEEKHQIGRDCTGIHVGNVTARRRDSLYRADMKACSAALIIDNVAERTAAALLRRRLFLPLFCSSRAFSSFVSGRFCFASVAGLLAVRSVVHRWPIRPLLIRLPLAA